jgi:peptide subunit release factor 1 (eRF1)
MNSSHHFLSDGHERASSASEPRVRAEVETQFADELSTASEVEAERLRKEIESAITERLDELVPPDALY